MITTKCPNCGKKGFEVVMFMGFYYTSCCDIQLEPDFEDEDIKNDSI